MRIVVTEFISMDGVIEDPGGSEGTPHGGWSFLFFDDEERQYKVEETMAAEAQLLGRVTYEGFAEAWPMRNDEFADRMNSMPKYVVSTTLRDAAWNNSTIISGDVPGEIAKLKEQPGGNLLVAGSATLVRTLLAHDLIDELRLMMHPVVLGSGKRLFVGDADMKTMALVDAKPFATGTVALSYRPAPPPPSPAS